MKRQVTTFHVLPGVFCVKEFELGSKGKNDMDRRKSLRKSGSKLYHLTFEIFL